MNAIAPYRGEGRSPLVQLAAGGVAADVRLDGTSYALRLAGACRDVSARLVGTLRSGDVVEFGALEVPAGSAGASRFSAPQQKKGQLRRVHLEIVGGDDLRLCLEAPLPSRRRAPLALRAGGALILAGVILGSGVGVAYAFPQSPVLAIPSRAVAGDVVHVAYATRGLGTASFRAVRDDGGALAAGTLDRSSGDVAIALPRSAAGHRVDLELSVHAPFGGVTRTASFPVVAPPPAAHVAAARLAQIVAFSARRERYAGRESVLASYLAVADRGELSVSDDRGRILAHAPFAHGGTQRLALPAGNEARSLTARLAIHRDASRAVAAMSLPPPLFPAPLASKTIAHGTPSLDAAPVSADDDVPEAVTPASADDPFTIAGSPIAGRPFDVVIRRTAASMQLRLEDEAGSVVAEVNVPSGARRVSLTPPAATSAQTYYLTALYGSGNGQEAVVRSVRVSAR